MNYFNLLVAKLRAPASAAAPVSAVGVWIRIMGYACEQENGGRLNGAVAWSDRQWLATCNVTADDVLAAATAKLLRFDGDDVLIWDYPSQRQAGLELLRSEGAVGGSVRSSAKANAARINGQRGGRPRIRDRETERKPNETERKPNGTQRNEGDRDIPRSAGLRENPREWKEKESVCESDVVHRNTTPHSLLLNGSEPAEDEAVWRERLRANWPHVNLERELERAKKYVAKERGPGASLQQRWFETHWLPKAGEPIVSFRCSERDSAEVEESEPAGWQAALSEMYPGNQFEPGGLRHGDPWRTVDPKIREKVRAHLGANRADHALRNQR